MKFRTTQKAIKEHYSDVIYVGYCNLQYLLKALQPMAYTTRVEGWASDVYGCENVETPCGYYNVAISTGYQPFGKVKPSWELQRKYDGLAKEVCDKIFDYEERKKQLNELLGQFIAEVMKEGWTQKCNFM